jgi:TonB family protein
MANYSARQSNDNENVVDIELSDMSAAHETASAAGAHSPLLVLSRDANLIDTVRKSTPRGTRVVTAPNIDQVASQLPTLQPGVLLIDTASATDVGSMVAQLAQHFPDMVVVVAGKSDDSQALMRLTASGQIYRFLLQPLSQGQTKLTLEAAVNRHQELGSNAKRLASTDAEEAPKANFLKNGIIAGVAVIALIGIIFFAMSKFASDKSADQQTADVVKKDPAEAELTLAKKALDAGKFVEPAGESALDLYRSALSIDPRSQRARDGIKAVADKILERGEKALISEKLEEAVAAVELARDIQPDHPRLAFMDEQIKRERERIKLTQAHEVGNRVSVLLAQAAQRMEADKLVTPANESARDSLAEARKLDPTDPAVLQANRDLINRVVEASKKELAAGNLDQAQSLANAARQMGYGGSGLAGVDRAANDARNAASRRASADGAISTARKRLNDGLLVEPAGDSAKDHIAAARAADPTRSEVAELNAQLANKLLDQGKQALGAQQLDRAKNMAIAARETGVRSIDAAVTQLERDIEARRAAAATVTKTATTATVATAPAPAPMAATPLKRTKYVEPQFPDTARRKGLTGWVEVSFTVTPKGTVEDAQVRASSPEDVFDDAAIRAVKQWRYEPPMKDGQPTAQRSAVRLKF